jgi:hypothetical protein
MIKTKLLFLTLMFLGAVLPLAAQDGQAELLARVNALRSSKGLPAYTVNAALVAAAVNQADWLANSGEVSHVQPDGSRPRDRANAAGYGSPWVGENIYVGMNATVDTAWDFWINSPVHYAGMTSPNYSEIGVAISQGRSRGYVLVFGAPEWFRTGRPASTGSGNTGNSGANNASAAVAPPPSYVVGLDAHGNIMHEIQEGDTLGDIALIYGYTWDVLPTMMALNALTEADVYGLDVGDVILVPPQSGTYTPTPGSPPTTETPIPTIAVVSDTPDSASLVASATLTPITVALAASPTELGLLPPVTYVLPTQTATHALVVRTLPVLQPTQVVVVADAESSTAAPPSYGRSLLLLGAIVVQAAVLGFAVFEFIRRRR